MPRVKSLLSGETPRLEVRYHSVMRSVGLGVVIASLVLNTLGLAPARASTADLVRQLDGLVSAFPGGTGLWIADPNLPAPLFQHDPQEPVITASLYKLGVLAEAERRVETGDLHYSDPVTIEPEDVTEDGSFEDSGVTLTLDEALEAMITISDNGAALALWHILGGSNIDATLTKAGMPDFHVAFDDSEDNVATPRAIGTFFTLLAKRQLISPAASDRMLARLERQQINNRLPAQLPPGVVVAHKTGNLPGLTHDAGIIYTKSGPRVVVAMTWDTSDDEADNFISSVGAIVYSAVLEPLANARYQVARAAIPVDIGEVHRISFPITNIGSHAWTTGGVGTVGLIWELRNSAGQLLTNAPRPVTLPALAPNETQNVSIDVAVPQQPGTYSVTIGLTDAGGNALASQGAATATFSVRAHRPYLVSAQVHMPILLHRDEPSLLITGYSALQFSGDHNLAISWRVIDTRNGRTVVQGSSPVGTLRPGASGTFLSSFLAPSVLGTYRLVYELTEDGVAVSETVNKTVDIEGPRTYGGDEGRPIPSGAVLPTPSPSPRFHFPQVTIPKPSLPIQLPFPHGKSPSPSPGP
jgi:beta-lactamase class A